MKLYKDISQSNYQTTDIISDALITMLPDIARRIIEVRPENENFIENPDDPKEHVINWHQFGIITHTRLVLKSFQIDAPKFFAKWKIDKKINDKLGNKIDGKSMLELIKIGIVLHDIGKFARNFKEQDGKVEHNFYGHEAISEHLIGKKFISKLLNESFKLSFPQIKYIGRIAGLHFELGKSRDAARKALHGYSIVFSKSEDCLKSCIDIASNYPEFKEEIGILFLCDSLGKIDIRINVEIEQQESFIKKNLEERKLNPSLLAAVKQLPVNIEITKKYLESI